MTLTRLPTKFGQGHSESIGYFQDEILPMLIENKIVCLTLRGFGDDGTELHFTMLDASGDRAHNLRMLGMLTEAQQLIVADLAET